MIYPNGIQPPSSTATLPLNFYDCFDFFSFFTASSLISLPVPRLMAWRLIQESELCLRAMIFCDNPQTDDFLKNVVHFAVHFKSCCIRIMWWSNPEDFRVMLLFRSAIPAYDCARSFVVEPTFDLYFIPEHFEASQPHPKGSLVLNNFQSG